MQERIGRDYVSYAEKNGIQDIIFIEDRGLYSMRYLTFALCKGRLAKKTMELLEKVGITCEEMKDPDTRKLIFVNEERN